MPVDPKSTPIAIAFAAGTQNAAQIAAIANKTSLQRLHLLKNRLVFISSYLSSIPRAHSNIYIFTIYVAANRQLEQTFILLFA